MYACAKFVSSSALVSALHIYHNHFLDVCLASFAYPNANGKANANASPASAIPLFKVISAAGAFSVVMETQSEFKLQFYKDVFLTQVVSKLYLFNSVPQ